MQLPYRVECMAYVAQIPLGEPETVEADCAEDVAAASAIVVDRCQQRFPDQVGVSFVVRASPLKGRQLIWRLRRAREARIGDMIEEAAR